LVYEAVDACKASALNVNPVEMVELETVAPASGNIIAKYIPVLVLNGTVSDTVVNTA
jgi:hypothetical protein